MKSTRKLLWIPQLVTFSGMFLGLLAMLWAATRPYAAAIAILLACTFDLLDGMIARRMRAESEFGAQLDSLADAINCGVAPAMLLYSWSLHGWMWYGIDLYALVLFAYIGCATGRLARFNVDDVDAKDKPKKPDSIPTFSGIPTPAGAMLIATMVMVQQEFGWTFLKDPMFLSFALLAIGALMISSIPFRSFKGFRTRWGRFAFFGTIIGGYGLLLAGGPGGALLMATLLVYVLGGLLNALIQRLSSPSKQAA